MTRVKVCGITREADRDAAIEAGTDALGFLVDVPVETDRELTPERAAGLIEVVPPFVTTVLVTMPESAERALELLELTGADAVQLHNDLPVEAVATVRDEANASVLKAIDAEPDAARRYGPVCDALLVDARSASGAGGTGRRSNWGRAADVRAQSDRPVVLAGGLTPDNVAAAIASVEPFGVDVSSGVERVEGQKDSAAVRAFIDAVAGRPVPT